MLKVYLIGGVFLIISFLSYMLARFAIGKYFESKKGRYDADKSNYLSIVAITALLGGFFTLFPSSSFFLINTCIRLLNEKLQLDYALFKPGVSTKEIIVFISLEIVILLIVYFSYKQRYNEYHVYKDDLREKNRIERTISFPEQKNYESPRLCDRIKEMFEISLKRFELKLNEKVNNKENVILYGKYSDTFNDVYVIIYCDSISRSNIDSEKVSSINNMLEKEIYKPMLNNEDVSRSIVHYYYIAEKDCFDNNLTNNQIKCYCENDYIDTLINFNPYLQKLVDKFNTDKLFSAISNEEDKKTLATTFIAPACCVGNKRVKSDLQEHVNSWLKKSVDSKHLVLLGDYGMGKTSFIKYYCSQLALDIINERDFSRYPVYISLTNCSPMHGGIDKPLKSFVSEQLGVDYTLFKRFVDRGKILFLLDSYDEMGFIGTNEQRFKQFNEIWQLATTNNKIILTGRPSYFPTEFELNKILAIPKEGHEVVQTRPYAEKLTLCNLDDNRIKEYIGKYYSVEETSKYYKWIKSKSALYELCKRPSMMHIIREMLEELYNNLSEIQLSSSRIMDKYVGYWINRQTAKGISSAFEKNGSRKVEFIEKFFTDLAVDFYLSNKHSMSGKDIIRRIDSLINEWELSGFEKQENNEGFHQEILSAFFIERADDEYKFVHKSFFEYFIASRIISCQKNKDFKNELFLKYWTLEITDYIYDSIPIEFINNPKVPALLFAFNNKFKAHLKLIHFKCTTVYNHCFTKLMIVLLPLNLIIPFVALAYKIGINESTVKTNNSTLSIVSIILVIIVTTLFSLLLRYLKRRMKNITKVTAKYISIGISKNEDCCTKYIKNLFSMEHITIRLYNRTIDTIYSKDKREFGESIFKNIEFKKVIVQNTNFFDSELKNVKFDGCQIYRLYFDDCVLINADFSKAKPYKYRFISNLGFVIYFVRIINRFFNRKKKLYNDYLLKFSNMLEEQIDDKTIMNLKLFIDNNNIDIERCILADKWLIDKLNC